MTTWKRLLSLFTRGRLDRDFDEEARAHLELATEDYIQRGHSPAEARRLAHVKFGAFEASKDAHRDARGLAWLEGLVYDLRHAIRGLARDRAFAITVILMLALAIGVNVTAFRVMTTILFSGFPGVQHNETLLSLYERYPVPGCCVTYDDFEAWRDQGHSFQGMLFAVPKYSSITDSNGDNRDAWLYAVTSNTFSLLGVQPIRGRDFTGRDETPGAPPAILISYDYWQTRMGGREDVLSQSVRVNDRPNAIIGVLPQGLGFQGRQDIWLPLELSDKLHHVAANGGFVYGRLAPGISETAARAEVEAINVRLAQDHPETNRDVKVFIVNYRTEHAGSQGDLVYGSVWAGGWLVLWIACANLANLTLARTQGRARELSTRIALGAGRGRVVRQLLLENTLLAVTAGLVAWWIAAYATLAWDAATTSPRDVLFFSAGAGTILYLVVVTLGAAALITLPPIASLWRVEGQGALKGEARGSTVSRAAKVSSAALVSLQMALAIVLIGAAGVLARSVWNVLQADIGVKEPNKILVGKFALSRAKFPTAQSRIAFAEKLQAQVASVPGVQSAAISDGRPVDDFEPHRFEFESHIGTLQGTPTFAAGPGYFETIGVSVLAGRDFNHSDRPGAPLTIVVNQRFAETFFPGGNAIGQRLRLYEKRQVEPGPWRTIVGIVSNIMQNEWSRQHFLPAAYLPYSQSPATGSNSVWFFARTPQISAGIASSLRDALHQMNPSQELEGFATLQESVARSPGTPSNDYAQLSTHATIAPIYAGIALLLAAVGLYSVASRSADQRTREIGVRMALGATSRGIQRMMLAEAMTPVAIGLVLGLTASLAVNRILESQLIGVSPFDLLTLTLAPVILIAVALLGSLLPVRRAARVDPAITLRHE